MTGGILKNDSEKGAETSSVHLSKGVDRVARIIGLVGLFVSSLSLLVNAVNSFETLRFNKFSKRVDATITWCNNISNPAMLELQGLVSDLRKPAFSREAAVKDGFDVGIHTPEDILSYIARRLAEDPSNAVDLISASKEVNTDMKALVGLLNFLEVGAGLVEQENMDRGRFQACFKDYVKGYDKYYDNTLIGIVVSRRNESGDASAATFYDATSRVMQPVPPQTWKEEISDYFR